MYYERMLNGRWCELSHQFPVLMLTGPRQVGKTTFLRNIAEKGRTYVTLDDPVARLQAREDPALFFRRYHPPVIIDEIQYAPNLMPYIKMQVDSKRTPGSFWLTGSQKFLMMKGISETLAGRVGIVNMLGLSSREQHRLPLDVPPFLPEMNLVEQRGKSLPKKVSENIFKTIWCGSMPALITGSIKDRGVFYSSYLQTYLQRDVRDLINISDETTFVRFLKACAARTGQMLNMADLARDSDITPMTAKHWLSILQASFQIYLLQPYHSNFTKRLVKAPKLYFLDTGLCSYLTEWSSSEVLEAGAMSGAILETYVLSELLKSWWHQAQEPPLYYYRDKDKREIDFVFARDNALYAIEVKKAASPKSDWANTFGPLEHLKIKTKGTVVLSLVKDIVPLGKNTYAVPIKGYI